LFVCQAISAYFYFHHRHFGYAVTKNQHILIVANSQIFGNPISPMKLSFDSNLIPHMFGVYIVGGSVRDLLYGKKPSDYDIVVEGDPGLVARRLAAKINACIVEFGKAGQKIIRVIGADHRFDIMPVNGRSIDEDLRRRDFTINAMALDLATGNLIDRFGGLGDLAEKKIRMVSDEAFRRDPVRLIRAFRLKASLELGIARETENAISKEAHLITGAAGERVREEFFKILKCGNSHDSIFQMAHNGLLYYILTPGPKIEKNWIGKDLSFETIQHILSPYQQLEGLLKELAQLLPTVGRRLSEDVDQNRAILLKFAASLTIARLLVTRQRSYPRNTIAVGVDNDDAITRATEVCRRLRCSRKETDFIEILLKNETRTLALFNARQKMPKFQKAMMRFFMDCGNSASPALLFAMANVKGAADPTGPLEQQFSDFILKLMETYYVVFRQEASLPPLLNGHDLITEFGLAPSPVFRQILEELRAERLLNLAMTRPEAIAIVKEMIRRQRI
jgi:poly(A) polymerase